MDIEGHQSPQVPPEPAPSLVGESSANPQNVGEIFRMTVAHVRAVANVHHHNRKLDPGKFKGVKSKVGRNIQVIN